MTYKDSPMEYVKCNLCGADDTKFMFYVRDRNSKEKKLFNLVKCRRCGFVYLNPRPGKEEIKKYYPPWYHSRAQTKVVNIEKTKIWGIPWKEAMQKKTEPILRYKKEGRILDIGCGDGSLLKFMKELGWQTYGVDFNKASSRYARDVLGLNVSSKRLEEANYPEGFFDIIILFHVLEHLPDPLATLKKVHLLLSENGFLLIEVPNFGSFESLVFRSKWIGIAAPLHLYHFTPRTLRIILTNCGFIPVELGFIPEQTKYVAGYSESLRYCLMDWGLYPPTWKGIDSGKKANGSIFSSYSWNNPLHLMEYMVFYPVAYFMDKIGLGSNSFAVARRKN
jgi:2-polyprenyl-3-methyl-5-hydroxy-6-metoxy-1,4-benzoquinol methylase